MGAKNSLPVYEIVVKRQQEYNDRFCTRSSPTFCVQKSVLAYCLALLSDQLVNFDLF